MRFYFWQTRRVVGLQASTFPLAAELCKTLFTVAEDKMPHHRDGLANHFLSGLRAMTKKDYAEISESGSLLRITGIGLLIRNPPSLPSCELFPMQLVEMYPPLITYF